MTIDNATDYAAHLAESIRNDAASDAPFGYVRSYDDNTADSLEEIDGYDPEEHDGENLPEGWEKATGWDYIRDALDIRYVVNSDRSYRSAEIVIGIGGPSAYIDTASRELVVMWWSEPVREPLPASFVDALDEAAAELWEMSA